jgi:hypothetical protein
MITLAQNADGYLKQPDQNGGNSSGNGKKIIQSLLYEMATGNTDLYGYSLHELVLAIANSNSLLNSTQSCNFSKNVFLNAGISNIWGNTGACSSWKTDGQNYDFSFNGLSLDEDDFSYFNQNYQFSGIDSSNNKYVRWNYTSSNDRATIWNRALGNTTVSTSQTSNPNSATEINSISYLLGLQAINSYSNRDSVTNRPQLQTSYRATGDAFPSIISDDDDTNGSRARTGLYNIIYLKLLISYLFFKYIV